MDVPLEVWGTFAVVVFGSITALEGIGTRKIREKFKDLQVGEPQRSAWVAEQLSKLITSVNSSVELISGLANKADPQKTTELKANMQKTVDLVEDIESVQNAQDLIIMSMRSVRDRGTYIILVSALIVALWIASLPYPSISGTFDTLGVVYVYAIAIVVLMTVVNPYREGRRVERLLNDNHLYKIGG